MPGPYTDIAPLDPGGYLIGQRVIVYGDEIGVICRPEQHGIKWDGRPAVWVRREGKGAAAYDWRNVSPLPGGQL